MNTTHLLGVGFGGVTPEPKALIAVDPDKVDMDAYVTALAVQTVSNDRTAHVVERGVVHRQPDGAVVLIVADAPPDEAIDHRPWMKVILKPVVRYDEIVRWQRAVPAHTMARALTAKGRSHYYAKKHRPLPATA